MDDRPQEFQSGYATSTQQNGYARALGTVAPNPVRPQSVLQPVSSSGTGLATPDRERKLQMAPNPNGASQTTNQLTTQRKYPFLQIS